MDDFLANLRESYLALLATRSRELRALRGAPAEAAEWDQIRLAAHTLAGSGGTYGYPRLSELATELEVAAEHDLEGCLGALLEELDRAISAG